MTTQVLNLYAGIGGNRKLWDEVEDIEVTAVEWDADIAKVYRDNYPDDTVVETDAHEYLKENIFEGWDFIWSSPPCPTHGTMNPINHVQHGATYPDMNLYQELILLRQWQDREGYDYCVENVQSYYKPLIDPTHIMRHYFWSNFIIPDINGLEKLGMRSGGELPDRDLSFDLNRHQEVLGYDLSDYDLSKTKKGKILRNCVRPELGKHIFKSRGKQTTLF